MISALALDRKMTAFRTAPIKMSDDEIYPVRLELTYITERIIGLIFPSSEHEDVYRASIYDLGLMLSSKHGTNHMLINLSERRSDLSTVQNQVLEFGWPDSLAPSLERLCSICKSIDQWLNLDPRNVVVIHCKGGLGRMGVVVSSYVDYSNICASADQALDQFAMKRFCDTKLAAYTEPSQRRYAQYFAGLLSGAIRVSSQPLFLYKVRICGLPSFSGRSNCRIFVKIYQSMTPVYVSRVYASSNNSAMFVIPLEPCLQLRGDILFKCFSKSAVSPLSSSAACRHDLVFQCQFHTCAVLHYQLKFGKCDLDTTLSESFFSDDGLLELLFMDSSEDGGRYDTVDDLSVPVDSPRSQLNRQWNSYEDLSVSNEESPSRHSGLTNTWASNMQHTNGSLHGGYYTSESNTMKNQSQVGRGNVENFRTFGNAVQREEFNTGHSSSVADYPKSESSGSSNDVVNLMLNNNSRFPHKPTKDEAQLDALLREFLEDQKQLQEPVRNVDSSKFSSTVKSPPVADERDGVRVVCNWQQTIRLDPSQSQMTKEVVSSASWVTSPRSPEKINRWGLSKPHMWTNRENQNGLIMQSQNQEGGPETHGQHILKLLNQQSPGTMTSTARFYGSNQPGSAGGAAGLNSPNWNDTSERSHNTLVRSKSSGYRNCASDTEDSMSWLEEQHQKLRKRREGTLTRQRSQQEKRLISELKSAQNTIRANKMSQSDTEDLSPESGRDFRINAWNARMRNQNQEFSSHNGHGFKEQYKQGPSATEFSQLRIGQQQIMNSHSNPTEGKHVMFQAKQRLSPEQSLPTRGGRPSFESTTSNGFVSPVTPSREAALQVFEAELSNGQGPPNLDELERSLRLTFQSMSRSRHPEEETGLNYSSSGTRTLQYQNDSVSPFSTNKHSLSLPDSAEMEEEVIKLKPIGQGVRNLEPATGSPTPLTSYPVQVVVSSFPMSPVTPYDNEGVTTIKRGVTASKSVPLSLSTAAHSSGVGLPSPSADRATVTTATVATPDLHRQQELIKQQLVQQQLQQQQLQQQLQQLQQLQQQHQIIQKQLQEQRQQQQLIQRQQHVEPHVHQQMVQQQQSLEQQLLQQQQQLLLLQQQLQQQQQVPSKPTEQMQVQRQQGVQVLSPTSQKPGIANSQSGSLISVQLHQAPSEEHRKPGTPSSERSLAVGTLQQSFHTLKTGSSAGAESQQSFMQTMTNAPQKQQSVGHVTGHQTLGRTQSAQKQTVTWQQSGNTLNHSQEQQLVKLQQQQQQQQQQQLLQQQQQLQQKQKLSGQMNQNEIIEDVVKKVHVVTCGGDWGIPPIENVLGTKSVHTSSSEQGFSGALNNQPMPITVDTALSLQSSPKTPSDSGYNIRSPVHSALHGTLQRTFSGPGSPNSGTSRAESLASQGDLTDGGIQTPRFVRDTSHYWHKPNLTREEVIVFLKGKPAGTFIIRNSNTFQGAFGLAVKVAQLPPNVQPRTGDLEAELVRHFLIESTPKGVRLKGCSNEPTFGSLAALVYQHSMTPLALPCKLLLPELDLSETDSVDAKTLGSTSNDGVIAGSNVHYISSIDLESLTGPEAVSRAIEKTFTSENQSPKITEVHFKVTSLGITLTDNKRRLFFRRHYPFNTITHCGVDAKDRRFTVKDENEKSISSGRIFGFVARKPGSMTENSCHLFSELDPSQPATAIANAVTKVLISGDASTKS